MDTPAGRAVSTDGLNWELQLLAPRPGAWGSLNANGNLDYARYAVWSAAEGLARYPRGPAIADAARHVETLLDAVRRELAGLPFALDDPVECWLCVDDRPVALLATAPQLPERRTPPPWRAFPEDPRATAVESAVRGLNGVGIWFDRGEPEARKVSPGGTAPAEFPELLLDAGAFPKATRSLIEDYLERLAPRLLTLQLTDSTRGRLERSASADAAGVEHFHRLYPRVRDAELITRLRVEARLRGAA